MRYERLKFWLFYNFKLQRSIEYILGTCYCIVKCIIYGDLEDCSDYWFYAINNLCFALKYFYLYNHGRLSNNHTYLKLSNPNILKVYIFVMYKSRRIIWHVIRVNRTLLKMWPLFTLEWISAYICFTKPSNYIKVYIFVIYSTKRIIWYATRHI